MVNDWGSLVHALLWPADADLRRREIVILLSLTARRTPSTSRARQNIRETTRQESGLDLRQLAKPSRSERR
jgi:hypothetical protein